MYKNKKISNDFVYVKKINIEMKQQVPIATVLLGGKYTRDMRLQFALQPLDNHRASVMGVGRYRGDILNFFKSGLKKQLRFSGYELVKVK